ncbi:hypothetical protein ACWDBO_14480 [Streptomyces mirabilis]|uniref:hypothetical protein n=1 Tax=Streptomyces TaxID=1883 RepID=UPI003325B29F
MIEQAKGRHSERQSIDIEQAFRPARLCPFPQPAPVRHGPRLHRRLRTPPRPGRLTTRPRHRSARSSIKRLWSSVVMAWIARVSSVLVLSSNSCSTKS